MEEVIILDIGSDSTKCGFAGDDCPKKVIRSVIADSGYGGDALIGDEALKNRGKQDIYYLMERGKVVDWNKMEKFYKRCFQSLEIENIDGVMPTAPPGREMGYHMERCSELLFEKFSTKYLYIPPLSGVLALYASGRTTGIVLDCGAGVTSSTPIWEGYVIHPDSINFTDVSGNSVNEYLGRLVSHNYSNDIQKEDLKLLKEEFCYIPPESFKSEFEKFQVSPSQFEREYSLPDGSSFTLNKERFLAPEKLFDPQKDENFSLYSHSGDIASGIGMADILIKSINFERHCPQVRKDFYMNIVVSGGSTLMTGFVERLQNEIVMKSGLEKEDYNNYSRQSKLATVKVNAPAERIHSVWIGASILGSLSTFQSFPVSKEEYLESGSSAVLQKCEYFKSEDDEY